MIIFLSVKILFSYSKKHNYKFDQLIQIFKFQNVPTCVTHFFNFKDLKVEKHFVKKNVDKFFQFSVFNIFQTGLKICHSIQNSIMNKTAKNFAQVYQFVPKLHLYEVEKLKTIFFVKKIVIKDNVIKTSRAWISVFK